MGYRVYNFGRKGHASDAKKFEEAAMMVEDGLECMRELADEMEDRYSERMYGMRYGMREHHPDDMYGMRDRDWGDMDGMYGMRRRRDSRGRYM